MEINQLCVVALTWTLKDTLGETLDLLDEPVEFLVGGSDLLPVIDAALQGHSAGAKLDLHIEPEQGFGDFNEQLILLEPRELFPADLQEGMSFEGASLPKGCRGSVAPQTLCTVTDIYPEHVVLDGNHPLALLLDEPFARLDVALRERMRTLVFGLVRARKIPALLVSHDLADVADPAHLTHLLSAP